MMIDRRAFVACTAAAAATATAAPALAKLPLDAAPAAAEVAPIFMIDGWNTRDGDHPEDQVWLRVGHGWRTAWR